MDLYFEFSGIVNSIRDYDEKLGAWLSREGRSSQICISVRHSSCPNTPKLSIGNVALDEIISFYHRHGGAENKKVTVYMDVIEESVRGRLVLSILETFGVIILETREYYFCEDKEVDKIFNEWPNIVCL